MSTSPSTSHDVVVVGARAAGAATAMLLARDGLDVAVIDRGRYGADTLSTHALMRAAVIQLRRWGLLDRVVASGVPAVRRTTFTYADDEIRVTVKPAHGVDALYAPRRTVLDPILVDAASAAGAEIAYGTTVTGLEHDDAGRVVGVKTRDAAGRLQTRRATWVVGADGIRSAVARAVDPPVDRRGCGRTASMYGYWSGLPTDGYHWIFRPRAFAGLIPTNDGLTCAFAAGPPERVGRGGPDVFTELLREASSEIAAQVADAVPATAIRTFTGLAGYMRRPWGPGWALVGDAGAWKDPISAHGLTDALRDAELLARAIVAAEDGAGPEALEEYHRTRDRVSIPLFDVVDTIATARWTEAEIPQLLRRLSSAMTDEVELVDGLDGAVPIGAGLR